VFGAMLTPQPEVVSREMFRVVRPGGTVGMANWTQDGFQSRLFGLFASYSPEPEAFPRPTEVWGTEELVRGHLEDLAGSLTVERGTLRWEGESPEAMFDEQSKIAGPPVALRRALPDDRWAELRREAIDLIAQVGEPAGGGIAVEGDYLVVVARKRG
jgi:hypothetical protein